MVGHGQLWDDCASVASGASEAPTDGSAPGTNLGSAANSEPPPQQQFPKYFRFDEFQKQLQTIKILPSCFQEASSVASNGDVPAPGRSVKSHTR